MLINEITAPTPAYALYQLVREDDDEPTLGPQGAEAGDEPDEVEKQHLLPFPNGTYVMDVSDVYDWYKIGQQASDLDDMNPNELGQGPSNTMMVFMSPEEEAKMKPLLARLGLGTKNISGQAIEPEVIDAMKTKKVEEMLRRHNGKWALVSKSNPNKVLQYYRGGDERPSKEWVDKVERRIQYFKHKG
jgi:hypothetical protein